MTTSQPYPASPGEPAGAATRLRRVIAGSLVGTTVEWYDFFLYGVAASTVFGSVFFPKSDPLTATLLSFLTYALGFVARPLGGLVFGHFGDRIGRKRLLVVSLLMMGVSSFAIGLLPTYQQIGVGAPLLLTGLRLIQGFALGGEWGGAVLMVSEHGSARHRGFWASWPQAGAPAGQLIANGVLALLAAVQSDADFTAWGWRIPFLLSAVLVLSGLWVRLKVEESPLFVQARQRAEQRARENVIEKLPVLQVFRRYPREILTSMGARIAENTSYYIFTIVIATYAKDQLHAPKGFALDAVMIGAAFHLLTIPMWGSLSDRIGRRPLYLFGAAGVGVWAFAFFALVNTKQPMWAAVAVVVGLLFHGAMYGPQAAFFAEMFGTRVRYSGVSIGYQLSSILAGAIAPLIAVALLKQYHSGTPIAVYVAICGAISLVAVLSYRETRDRNLAEIGEDSPVEPASTAGVAVA